MKILCDSGLVTSRQEGKWTHYRLSSGGRERAVKRLLRADHARGLEDDTRTEAGERARAEGCVPMRIYIKLF